METGVLGGIWSNWGADYADDKGTVCHREGGGDGQWILCDEGASRDVSTWGVWDKGDQEENILAQVLKWRCHCGVIPRQGGWGVYDVCGDMDGHK